MNEYSKRKNMGDLGVCNYVFFRALFRVLVAGRRI